MSKIKYGTVELDADEFSPAYAKQRISIWLDESTLNAFRELAKKNGTKYQTLINEALKKSISEPSLADRVKHLEEFVFKKAI